MKKYLLSGILATIVVIIDQLTKFLIKANIPLKKSIVVVDRFFHLTHVRNTGGAFSLLSEASNTFFMITSSIALVIVLIYLVRTPSDRLWHMTSLSLIFGGAVGNMIDRIRFGEVIDFIDLFYKDFHWPAFNIADSAITTGVLIIFIDMVFSGRKK